MGRIKGLPDHSLLPPPLPTFLVENNCFLKLIESAIKAKQ